MNFEIWVTFILINLSWFAKIELKRLILNEGYVINISIILRIFSNLYSSLISRDSNFCTSKSIEIFFFDRYSLIVSSLDFL